MALWKVVCAVILFLASVPFAGAQLTFISIAVPGAHFTAITGINSNGDLVGYYAKTERCPCRSFLIRAGKFKPFSFPGATTTLATGINDAGLIVGSIGTVRVRGFTYDGATFTSFRDGNNSATFGLGINNAGEIVGGTGSIYTTQGYVLQNHSFESFSPPGNLVYVYATGINNLGDIVGWTDYDGFLYQNGQFQTITYPGASKTEALGINDSGVIVGWYISPDCSCGFALTDGQFVSFTYPGAKVTLAYGIDTAGQIVGAYTTDYKTYRGFVSSPLTLSR
jgi:uncharacterized membrane protein